MVSTIAILNTSRSGPGQSLTLVYYSSVFPKIAEVGRFKLRSRSPLQKSSDPWYSPVFQFLLCEGDITRVELNGDVDRRCVLMQGKYIYIPSKWTFFRILHQNRAQNIIQYHDKNIWKQMCITKLYYSNETYLQYNVQM